MNNSKTYVCVEEALDVINRSRAYMSDVGRIHAINAIKEAAEIDSVEVVYAHWDENGRCTNCGGHAPYYAMSSNYYKSPYCFECGAEMN